MLKIKVAKNAGFCFGVRRAIEIAEETLKYKSKVYTLGPIIHNPQEVKRLEKQGIKTLKSVSRIKDGHVILRTHGIPLDVHKKLNENRNINIIDSTCPFVKRAQDVVKKLSSNKTTKDSSIVIVGEKVHPEVVALVSYGNKNCVVIETPKEARTFKDNRDLSIVSQTTQTYENFDNIVNILSENHKTSVYNTICRATLNRQQFAEKLACGVDLMLVIGGKNSGNTTRLAQICSCKTRTYHIETFRNLRENWFKNISTVGLTAGASTPDWIIKDVEIKVNKIGNSLNKLRRVNARK
ncbi:MAG: 4-hydroxy-3-methylbut-2-enyl diphosphate reductase [Endomicrobium sp.]|jgi:4-hydroxy-3-methylbut-2-enyl diphosphate reductase|nr:4-hydroxy-3-methylbut-2-enyl diphosphate reductase [Endomicrobium sp.]